MEEFPKLLEDVLLLSGKLIIFGDFNIHVDNPTCKQARSFIDLIDAAGLAQHVHQSTHKGGHTLDLILTRSDQVLSNVQSQQLSFIRSPWCHFQP